MKSSNSRRKYADIIDLPHHSSATRPHMSMYDRAAQFSSYKALSGYEDMVAEEARLTDSMKELPEYETDRLNMTIGAITDMLSRGEHPRVSVSYFEPDRYKRGGSYKTLTAVIKRIDTAAKKLIFYGSDDIEDRRVPPVDIPHDRVTDITVL